MRLLSSANGEVLGLAFGPDGSALVAAVEKHGVFLFDLTAAGPPVRLDPFASKRARQPFFSPDGRTVHWLGKAGWRCYDRDTRRISERRLDAPGKVLLLAQTPDGSRLISEHSFPGSALIGWGRTDAGGWEREWEVSTAAVAVHGPTLCPTGRQLANLARLPHGRRPGEDLFRLELRSAVSGAVKVTGRYPYRYECRLAFAPAGDLLAGVHDMTLLVWRVPTLGEPLLLRNDNRQHFTAAAFHPSGRHLFATSNDTMVHVFDAASWARVARYTWELGRLRAVAVSPDGTVAAAGGDRGEVVVWDVDL